MEREKKSRADATTWRTVARSYWYLFLPAVVIVTVWGARVYANSGPIPQLSRSDGELVDALIAQTFDPSKWEVEGPSARGSMIEDLLKRHQFVGDSAVRVKELLGENECYVLYDDEPCYQVDVDGKRYELQFVVAHSGPIGTVLSVKLEDRSEGWWPF